MGNRSSSPKAHRKTASPQLASDARAAKTNAEVWAARSTAGAVFICVAAALLRLPGISRDFPALTDEAIYLRWAEIIVHQNQWFVSLLDGKQPLSYWLYALIRFASDTDPLLAARAVSLLAGALTALLIYAIGKRLGGPVGGLAGALCWSVFPWSMVYDRLA